MTRIRFAVLSLLALRGTTVLLAQVPPDGLGRGWSGEFEHAARQLVALAEATPAEKLSFRPGQGVRSTSEVYMHVAVGNYWLLAQAGVKAGRRGLAGPNPNGCRKEGDSKGRRRAMAQGLTRRGASVT